MKASEAAPDEGRASGAGLAILAALMILTRPWRWIEHDGHLYAAQALRRLEPALADDLFFAFGNQDSFSLFTAFYAPAIDAFGLTTAHLVFWMGGLAVGLAGLWSLARALFGAGRPALLAASIAIVAVSSYGNLSLSALDGFVTPRIWAEGVGLLSLACAVRQRWVWAAGLWLIAAALHPLMALPCLALIVWLAVRRVSVMLALAAGALALGLGLGAAGIAPFTWLYQPMDSDWFALIVAHVKLVLITHSALQMAIGLMLPLTGLILVLRLGADARLRLILQGVLGLWLAGIVVGFLGGDVLQNRLILGLQVWRGQFLLALLGLMCLPHVWRALPPRGLARVILGAAIGASVAEHAFAMVPASTAILSLGALIAGWPRRVGFVVRAVCVVLALLALLSAGAVFLTGGHRLDSPETLRLVLTFAVWLIVLWPLRAPRLVRMGLAVASLVAAVSIADDRSARERWLTAGPEFPPGVLSLIEGRQVYWEDGRDILWFHLRRPQFYSCRQKGGIVFFRDQAMEFSRRAAAIAPLNTADFPVPSDRNCPDRPNPYVSGPLEPAQIETVCRATPDLDAMILYAGFPGLARAEVQVPPTRTQSIQSGDAGEMVPQYLYECGDFR